MKLLDVIDMPAIAKSDLSLTGLAAVLRTRVFDASETSYGVKCLEYKYYTHIQQTGQTLAVVFLFPFDERCVRGPSLATAQL